MNPEEIEYTPENTFPPVTFRDKIPVIGNADVFITAAKQHFTDNGNSWHIELEVLTPAEVEINGSKHTLAGTKIQRYVSLKRNTLAMKAGLFNFLTACGYRATVNANNNFLIKDGAGNVVDTPFVGKTLRARLEPETRAKQTLETLSEAQVAAGAKAKYVDVLEGNRKVYEYKITVAEWLGPSDIIIEATPEEPSTI